MTPKSTPAPFDAYCDDDAGNVVRVRVWAKSKRGAMEKAKKAWVEEHKCPMISQSGYYLGATLVTDDQAAALSTL